jgi:hypothetical protein
MAVIDENLPAEYMNPDGYLGLALVKERNRRTPVIMLTSLSEIDTTIKPLNPRVSLHIQKPLEEEYLRAASDRLLEEYKRTTPKLLKVEDNTIIKTAETAFEFRIWGQLRYKVYVEEDKLIKKNKLKADLHEKKEEWDDYDKLPSTKQIIALRYEEVDGKVRPACIAGSRQMIGVLAMDKIFYLNEYRKRGVVPRQVCRFIVEKAERGRPTLLIEFLRYLFDIYREYPVAFCTSRDHQISLFEKIGFTVIGNSIESEQYGLDGKWTPMIFDPISIWRSFADNTQMQEFPRLNQLMYNAIISPILSPDDRMKLGTIVHADFEKYIPKK